MIVIHHIIGFLREMWFLLGALSPYLLLGFGIAGILHIFIPEGMIEKHLGGKGFLPIVKAAVFGVPLPICSCGVIPIAASLRKEGASKASTLSFLVSTPTSGVDSIFATYSLMGPLFAIFRPIAALLGGILVGGVSSITVKEDAVKSKPRAAFGVSPHKSTPFMKKVIEVLKYGYIEMIESVGKSVLIGIIIGAAISYLVPASYVERYLSSPFLSFGIVLLISVPLYVCATGSIPIATSLLMKGLSPGAALVFLIAGPATNTVTISVVLKQLGKRALIVYLISIVLFSLGAGVIFNYIWAILGARNDLILGAGRFLPEWLRVASSVVLLGLIIANYLKGEHSHEEVTDMKYLFDVPGISCPHCKAILEKAVGALPGVERAVVSVEDKNIAVDGEAAREAIIEAIENAGYEVKKEV